MTDAIPTTGQSPSGRDNYLEIRRLGEYGHYILPLTDLLAEAALFLGLETDMSRYHKETCSILRASQGVHPEEAAVLYGLVRSLKPQLILETGTFEGYSTAEIARALQKNGTGHLESVDIADKTGFRVPDNLQQFVTFRRSMPSLAMTTVLAQQKVSVELFFHDSAHTYCNALDELIAFAPFFSSGCVIVCHDAKMDFMPDFGVGRAVREFAQAMGLECAVLDTTCGMALMRWPQSIDDKMLQSGLENLKRSLAQAKADQIFMNRARRIWRILKRG